MPIIVDKEGLPYWKVALFLNKLRLVFKERERKTALYHLIIPDFGTVISFDNNIASSSSLYKDWDVVDIKTNELVVAEGTALESLFWHFIEKGYFAYIRGKENNPSSKVFRHFIIDEGWGTRIIDKRLNYWGNQPRYKFLIERNRRVRALPPHFLLMNYPDFFDRLY